MSNYSVLSSAIDHGRSLGQGSPRGVLALRLNVGDMRMQLARWITGLFRNLTDAETDEAVRRGEEHGQQLAQAYGQGLENGLRDGMQLWLDRFHDPHLMTNSSTRLEQPVVEQPGREQPVLAQPNAVWSGMTRSELMRAYRDMSEEALPLSNLKRLTKAELIDLCEREQETFSRAA